MTIVGSPVADVEAAPECVLWVNQDLYVGNNTTSETKVTVVGYEKLQIRRAGWARPLTEGQSEVQIQL
jgi:hypothetical protein